MKEVTLSQEAISNTEINNCIEAFYALQDEENPALHIIAKSELTVVNILLPAYLTLFKKIRPDLQIRIFLKKNSLSNLKNTAPFKLLQHRAYAYLMLKTEPFDIYIGEKDIFQPLLNDKGRFTDSTFVLSESFMLLLLVSADDPHLYRLLFEANPMERQPLWFLDKHEVTLDPNPDKTYTIYNKKISEAADPKRHLKCIVDLGRLSFLDSLKETGIITYYLASQTMNDEELKKKDYPIKHFKSKGADADRQYRPFEYFESIRFVFDELKSKPLLYHFIFSQLVSSNLLPELTKDEPEKTAEAVAGLWQFTKDLSYGIKELATNILQHAKDKKGNSRPGMVCAQFIKSYLTEEKKNYKKQLPGLFQSYIDELAQSDAGVPDALLEMHVLDLGENGIRSTLLASCKKNITKLGELEKGKDMQEIFLHDIDSLEKGHTALRDLVSHANKGMLVQQSKRSIAHLGLLIFNKLIRKNDGLIITSTSDLEDKREWHMEPSLDIKGIPGAIAGTRITFLLPVIAKKTYQLQIPHPISIPVESASVQVKGIETIFDVIPVKPGWQAVEKVDGKTLLLEINLVPASIADTSDREEEDRIWNEIKTMTERLTTQVPSNQKILINLNFENCQVSPSKLFRLMGRVETEFSLHTTLITNLPHDIFRGLIDLNQLFMELFAGDLPYWSDENVTLIYHYIEKDCRFYFTDGLWGRKEEHFYQLNRLIHRNHFNAITILNNIKPKYKKDQLNSIPELANSAAFYNSNVLLPLDLLLPGKDNMTIFEHNAMVLLNNPIKSNTVL